jgi:hypothetical protein
VYAVADVRAAVVETGPFEAQMLMMLSCGSGNMPVFSYVVASMSIPGAEAVDGRALVNQSSFLYEGIKPPLLPGFSESAFGTTESGIDTVKFAVTTMRLLL